MLVNKKQEWNIEQEQTALPSIAQKSRINTNLRAKCFIIVIMAAVIAMFVTMRSETIIRAGYDLVQMKAQLIKLEKENDSLRLDIAKLKSPQRIQSIATTELGMVVPQNIYCAANNVKVIQDNTTKEEQSLLGQMLIGLKASKAEASKGR